MDSLVRVGDGFPTLVAVVLDAVNARSLAEFYRILLDFRYAPGDEWPPPGHPDRKATGWIVLTDSNGRPRLAIQSVATLNGRRVPDVIPQKMDIIMCVSTNEELTFQRNRAVSLGATLVDLGMEDSLDPLCVFLDPAGHPFCIMVGSIGDVAE